MNKIVDKVVSMFKVPDKTKFSPFIASMISILCGLLVGFLIFLIVKPQNAFQGLWGLFSKGSEYFDKVLYVSAPLILCGLSVAFANKCGLFNIGASGQYLIGAALSGIFAIVLSLPWYVCCLIAIIGGAFVGFISGLLKALFNVNEVISCIMLNWISLMATNLLMDNVPGFYNSTLQQTSYISNPGSLLPMYGGGSYDYINWIISFLVAILIYIIIRFTTFGFKLKSCGFNRDASRYAGISTNLNIVLAMTISGALSGLAGAMFMLTKGVSLPMTIAVVPAVGFNAIPAALLGYSNPIAVIFSSIFISYITTSASFMESLYNPEITNIIVGVIFYFSAFSLLVIMFINKLLFTKKKTLEASGVKE